MSDTFAQNILAFQGKFDRERQYWLEKMAGELTLSGFPPDEPRVGNYTAVREQLDFTFPSEVAQKLFKLSKGSELAMHLILITGITALLHQYTGNTDILIGTPVFQQKIEGQYVNHMVALRNTVNGDQSFRDLLLQVKATVSEASEYANFPLQGLIQLLGLEGDQHRSALFDTIVLLQNVQEARLVEGEKAETIFRFEMVGTTLRGTVAYYPGLHHRATVVQIIGHLIRYLGMVTDHPTESLAKLRLITADEEERILVAFNATTQEFATKGKTLHQLFAEAVERTPDKVAVIYGEQSLTYRELNEKANELAQILRQSGVQRGSIVGMLTEPSLEMIIGIYGVLKAGGAYLPIGPAYPKERITFTLKDSGATVLLTQSHVMHAVEFDGVIFDLTVWMETCAGVSDRQEGKSVCHSSVIQWVDVQGENVANDTGLTSRMDQGSTDDSTETRWMGTSNLGDFTRIGGVSDGRLSDKDVDSSRDLAYVIYTSGSTGKPKGVMVEHTSVVNTLTALQEAYPLMEDDAYLLKTAYTFDVSVTEIFGWFFGNGRLVILPKDVEKDPRELLEVIATTRITHLNFVPSMFNAIVHTLDEVWIRQLQALRYIFVAGEAIPRDLVRKFQSLGSSIRLENIYGPTETSIYATWYPLADLQGGINVPIGQPLPNVQAYIVDQHLAPQPIGVAGELCIAGAGLARGYLNRPDLTEDKFIPCPFQPGKRMYCTGDLARWLPNGNIEYLGRIDHQVKIRGFRIELGEIENQLLTHPAVQEAVVIDRTDGNGIRSLCAYLVANHFPGTVESGQVAGAPVTVADLRAHLLQQLPEYMIPAHFVRLEALPVTSSGKIDRKALPEPDDSIQTGAAFVAPEGQIEKTLAQLWAELLQIEVSRISALDHFFTLGGHSLIATQLVAQIFEEFQTEANLKMIFERPTLRAQAEWIAGAQRKVYSVIQRVEEREYYPATSAQKRIYLVTRIAPDSVVYNMPAVLEIKSPLDQVRLRTALKGLIQRQESLRTAFAWVDDQLIQRIISDVEPSIEAIPVGDGELNEAIRRFIRPFDLEQAPLMRVGVAETMQGQQYLLFDMHHIVLDGFSIGVLVSDFLALYGGETLPELPIQYRDFAVWQHQFFASEEIRMQEQYWLNQMAGEIPILNLPTDYPRPSVQSVEGERHRFTLDAETTARLVRFTQEVGVTPYMGMLAVYAILLSKYSGQSDLMIGSPVAGRRHSEVAHLIGMFVNTLALRVYPDGKKTFGAFLQEVKDIALNAMENQDYPFDTLVETLDLPRDLSRNPLFDVMFAWQSHPSGRGRTEHLEFVPYAIANPTSKFDLTLHALESAEGITLEIEYAVKLFARETIERMGRHLVTILGQGLQHPGTPIGAMEILSDDEKRVLLTEFNSEFASPVGHTVLEMVEAQALAQPQQVALAFQGQTLTYGELDARADELALRLRLVGVEAEEVVALMVHRSFEMIIGLLAIWKVGGAYLPIDPTYPEERVEYLLHDSAVRVVLTQTELISDLGALVERVEERTQLICIEDGQNGRSGRDFVDNQPMASMAKPHPEQLAYVIYTSGTTGFPKGVMVEHRNIANTIHWRRGEYGLGTEDAVLQLFSFSFDGFLTSALTPLASGATLVLLNEANAKDPVAIKEAIVSYEVNHFIIVPSLYGALLECISSGEVKSLRMVTLAGEAVSPSLLQRSREILPQVELINEYGPTENSVATTVERHLESAKRVTIGCPVANTQVYIVDQEMHLLPIGVPGELCIAGEGLARGYLRQPQMTAEKFIANPFVPDHGRMYRTGDLARWLSDGRIEFLGRTDHQVKIRGFRIEIGEIEARLLTHPAVQSATVVARADQQGLKHLCAYYVAGEGITPAEIKAHLTATLPTYMVPAYCMELDELPLTLHGKVDHRALPAPTGSAEQTTYVAPATEVESLLAQTWSELLGLEEVGVMDHFFAIGGDSIKAIQVCARLHKHQLRLEVKDLLQYPTIRQVAQYVRWRDRATGHQQAWCDKVDHENPLVIQHCPSVEESVLIPTVYGDARLTIAELEQIQSFVRGMNEGLEVEKIYPLSPKQEAMMNFTLNHPGSSVYFEQMMLTLHGSVDVALLQASFDRLVTRHDVLRTMFLTEGLASSRQVVVRGRGADFFYADWSTMPAEDSASRLDAFQQDDRERGFKLAHGPLMRMALLQMAEREYRLVWSMHHILVDGWCVGVMMNEVKAIYRGLKLGNEVELANPQPYSNYIQWLEKQDHQTAMRYWQTYLTGYTQLATVPGDGHAVAYQGSNATHLLLLGETESQGLRNLARQNQVTLNTVVQTLWSMLLQRYNGVNDVIFGTVVSGRPAEIVGVERMIGLFTNTLPVRVQCPADCTFSDLLAMVQRSALDAQPYDYYPTAAIQDLSDLKGNLFDHMLVFQNFPKAEGARQVDEGFDLTVPDVQMFGYNKHNFSLMIAPGKQMRIWLKYNDQVYSERRIAEIADDWRRIVARVITNPLFTVRECSK